MNDNQKAYRANAIVVVPRTNPFSKAVLVNRQPFAGLIDSSCSSVVVREAFVIKCQAEILPKPSPLFTVGDASQPGASIDGVTVYNHAVVVVPDRSIPVDVLVGRIGRYYPKLIIIRETPT